MKIKSFLISKKKGIIFGLFVAVLIIALGLIISKTNIFAEVTTQATNCKWLISYGVSHNGAYPEYIGVNQTTGVSNLQKIEALPEFPYNGLGIETSSYYGINAMHKIMLGSSKLGYQAIHDQYKPLIDLASKGIKPNKLKHNFLMVHLEDAGGFYDPTDSAEKAYRDEKWANVADNFANLTKVAKEINDSGFPIDGIFLDNEGPYGAGGFWYCGASYAPECNSSNLAAYQEQSRQRGKQIMAAITPYSYPGLHFMFMHSTDTSCTLDPNNRNNPPGLGTNWVEYANQLLGPFTVGLGESAKNTNVKVVDGGEESYGYLAQDYFTVSKDYRDKGLATTMDGSKLACYFIPPEDRTTEQVWSGLFETAFAMYNQNPTDTPGQTVDTIQQSMKLALQNTDNYVWFYIEGGVTTIGAPNATQIDPAWTHNIKLARDAVANDPSCGTAPSSTPTISSTPTPSPIPTSLPDLAITNVNISPANPVDKNEVLFTVDIKNQGTAATQTGTGIFLGAAFQVDGSWVTWSDDFTGSLAPGETKTLTPNYGSGGKSTWTATAGAHTLTTVVDNMNKISESNESNNTAQNSFTVGQPCSKPAIPDSLIAVQNPTNPSSALDLTWTDSTSDQDGFKLYRSLSPDTGFELLPATLNSSSRNYTDSNLSSATRYYYQLRSYSGTCESDPRSTNALTASGPQATLTVNHSPSTAGTKTVVTITANLAGSSAQSINIYVDNVLKKTCSSTSTCSYSAKFTRGTHTYSSTSVNPNLRDPSTGTKSFTIVWWKFW